MKTLRSCTSTILAMAIMITALAISTPQPVKAATTFQLDYGAPACGYFGLFPEICTPQALNDPNAPVGDCLSSFSVWWFTGDWLADIMSILAWIGMPLSVTCS